MAEWKDLVLENAAIRVLGISLENFAFPNFDSDEVGDNVGDRRARKDERSSLRFNIWNRAGWLLTEKVIEFLLRQFLEFGDSHCCVWRFAKLKYVTGVSALHGF